MTAPASGAFSRIVWPLALAETIVWAGMFYSFPALLLVWERDLGWSKTELSGAFTLALALSALLAPVAGRLIDRSLGHLVLTGSAALGAASLALLASTYFAFVCWLDRGYMWDAFMLLGVILASISLMCVVLATASLMYLCRPPVRCYFKRSE